MTALTRIIELLGTADRLHIEFTKFGRGSYFIRVNDLDDVNATAVGHTLEVAADVAVLACIHQGLMPDEECPRTEPGGDRA